MASSQVTEAIDRFKDWRWRLNNLYYITDKTGEHIKFEMNDAQEHLFDNMSWMNVILKARQRGFSTFIQIFMLDACLFNSNIRAGVIAHNLDDAKVIFRDKIKYAYDNLPDAIKLMNPTISDTSMELLLGNNSSIRVGTSMRSGTLQYLHISEYGKICAKYPQKAAEVRTGSLNTLQAGSVVFVESTAEGQDGHFFEICEDAQAKARTGEPLTPLDFKFHFYSWHDAEEYRLDPDTVTITDETKRYFTGLAETEGIQCDPAQMAWYQKKAATQKEYMKREFPSTAKEAFEAAVEGAYFGKWMAKAETDGRIGHYPFDIGYPVHTAWDLGFTDSTAIWFFQCLPGECRNVHYYENHGEFLNHYIQVMIDLQNEHRWTYGNAYVPHDIKVPEWASGKIRIEKMIEANLAPVVVPHLSFEEGIDAARDHLAFSTFDQAGCADGIKCMKLFRKEWDEERATWKAAPRRDWTKHGADAYRYEALGYREYKPADPLPPMVRGPDGKPIILGKRPKILTEMTFGEIDSVINDKYSRLRQNGHGPN